MCATGVQNDTQFRSMDRSLACWFVGALVQACVCARFRVRPTGSHIFMKHVERGMIFMHSKFKLLMLLLQLKCKFEDLKMRILQYYALD